MRIPVATHAVRGPVSALVLGASLLLLAACGGSGSIGAPATATVPNDTAASFSVTGSVSGLTGAGLSLSLNGGPALPIGADGNFVFPAKARERFAVTVASPAAGQTCTVSNATGASVTTNIDSVRVTCSSTTYTVRGFVGGLTAGQQVTLLNNGADPVVVAADGAYAFTVPVARSGGYAVTVGTQPTGLTCTVANAFADGVLSNATDVYVNCSATAHRVSGTVTGLAPGAHVSLLNNGGDATVVSANGNFAFATRVANNTVYAVTVGTQPTGQTCTVANRQGSNVTADVSNIAVSCAAASHRIGGTVSGLAVGQQVTLTNNGADPITLATNGAFRFATPIATQAAYQVVRGAVTAGLSCSLTNTSGSSVSADVNNVGVSCVDVGTSWVYIPDYGRNRVLGYSVDLASGARTELPGSPYPTAGTDNRWIAMNPAKTFVYTTNQRTHNVSAYTVNATTGELTAVPGSPFASGTNPQSIEISPDGRFAFVANGNSNNVSGYSIHPTTGALTQLPGSPWAAGVFPNKIAITPDSGHVYVTNSDLNTMSGYRIDPATGVLTPIAGSPWTTSGQGYGIAVHPSGDFLYVVNNQALLNVYRIDGATGGLTDLMPGGYTTTIGTAWPWQAFTTNGPGTVGYVATASGIRSFDINTTTGALTEHSTHPSTSLTNFVRTNVAGTRVYSSDFIAITLRIADIDPITGVLSPNPVNPTYVDARPYNFVVIER